MAQGAEQFGFRLVERNIAGHATSFRCASRQTDHDLIISSTTVVLWPALTRRGLKEPEAGQLPTWFHRARRRPRAWWRRNRAGARRAASSCSADIPSFPDRAPLPARSINIL